MVLLCPSLAMVRFHTLSHRYRLVSLLQRLIKLKMEATEEDRWDLWRQITFTNSGSDNYSDGPLSQRHIIYPPLKTIDFSAEKSKRYLRESVGH